MVASILIAVEPSEHKMFPMICLYLAMARSRPTKQSETGLYRAKAYAKAFFLIGKIVENCDVLKDMVRLN